VERLVLLSSQRARSGVPSASVAAVQAGEAAVAAAQRPCVVLRPTMIYGPGDDRNISRIVAFVRRHGWFPVFGDGQALQQPVFVGDVVEAIHAAASGRGKTGGRYDLAGPDPLPFVRLLDLIGRAVGRQPLKPRIPLWVAIPLLQLARAVGVRLPLEAEQVRRLQEDRSCSIAAAREDLGFAPLSFSAGLALSLLQSGSRGP
jgi:nucleoside-diphosphate-sugar epimerase